MNKTTQFDRALSFWTAAIEYLALVENVANETINQGNVWTLIRGHENGPITPAEYENATRWSDHTIIVPLLFNFYHGIELLVKGFLLVTPASKVEAKHTLQELSREFVQKYPQETEINGFLIKYTKEASLPPLLSKFLKSNGLSFNGLYHALRYPSNVNFQNLKTYVTLKYKGEDGLVFFRSLMEDINAVRRAAVKLGRIIEEMNTGQQKNRPDQE